MLPSSTSNFRGTLLVFNEQWFGKEALIDWCAPVSRDLGCQVYNFARNDWPEQVHFYYGTWVLPDSSTWVLNQSPQPDSLTRVRNLTPQPESSTWVLNLSSQLRFYIKIDEFYPKKHDFLVLRHPQKPRAKNKQKSAQKATQVVSSFGSLFRYFLLFYHLSFSCFFC